MQMGSSPSPAAANCSILSARRLEQEDAVGAVDALRDRLDLVRDRRVERIEEVERVRLVGGCDDRLGELRRALAAALERRR